jgi:hypothetical protein
MRKRAAVRRDEAPAPALALEQGGIDELSTAVY